MESFKLSSRLFSEIFWFSILNDTDTLANYKDQLTNELSDVDGIVVRTVKLSKKVLSNAKKLQVVARHGVGYDNVDYNFLNELHIC